MVKPSPKRTPTRQFAGRGGFFATAAQASASIRAAQKKPQPTPIKRQPKRRATPRITARTDPAIARKIIQQRERESLKREQRRVFGFATEDRPFSSTRRITAQTDPVEAKLIIAERERVSVKREKLRRDILKDVTKAGANI